MILEVTKNGIPYECECLINFLKHTCTLCMYVKYLTASSVRRDKFIISNVSKYRNEGDINDTYVLFILYAQFLRNCVFV